MKRNWNVKPEIILILRMITINDDIRKVFFCFFFQHKLVDLQNVSDPLPISSSFFFYLYLLCLERIIVSIGVYDDDMKHQLIGKFCKTTLTSMKLRNIVGKGAKDYFNGLWIFRQNSQCQVWNFIFSSIAWSRPTIRLNN